MVHTLSTTKESGTEDVKSMKDIKLAITATETVIDTDIHGKTEDIEVVVETREKDKPPAGSREEMNGKEINTVLSAKTPPSKLPPRPPRPVNRRTLSIDNSDVPMPKASGGIAENTEPHHSFGPLTRTDSALLCELEDSESLDNEKEARISAQVLGALNSPKLEDNTPAAAALRANAEIHVSRANKFARRMKVQSIRRIFKTATGIKKNGIVRGKPPRVPPSWGKLSDANIPGGGALSMPNLYAAISANLDEDFMDSSIDSEHEDDVKSIEIMELVERVTAPSRKCASVSAGLPDDRSQSDTLPHENKNEMKDSTLEQDKPNTRATLEESLYAHFSDTGIPTEVHTRPGNGRMSQLHKKCHKYSWKKQKKQKKKKDRSTYVKGKVIDGQHELYTLSIAMMLGLRTSIGRTNAIMNSPKERQSWLESDDFMHVEKYAFKPKGGPKTPPHELSHTFKFKDYSPKAFAYLRRLFGINEFDFLVSICGNSNFIEFVSNAKSGQFFFYSNDGKYMIKTMTNAESKFLRRILPHYFRHCAQNPNTLITQFLGMYRVKLYHLRRNVKFVIMNSVFDTDKSIMQFYDLKGSTLGRIAKPHQDVKKDNDFRTGKPESVLALYDPVRNRMRDQLVADCEFFKKMKIMDYSMLVGIHPIVSDNPHAIKGSEQSLLPTRYESRRDNGGQVRKTASIQTPEPAKSSEQHTGGILRTSFEARKDPVSQVGRRGASTPPLERLEKAASTASKNPPARQTRAASKSAQTPPSSRKIINNGVPSGNASMNTDEVVIGPDSVYSLPTVDYVYEEEDDDNSYLEGSDHFALTNKPDVSHFVSSSHDNFVKGLVDSVHHRDNVVGGNTAGVSNRAYGHIDYIMPVVDSEDVSMSTTKMDDVEVKKNLTAQQMFWPFHRFYNIDGRRRMMPSRCPICEDIACSCDGFGADSLQKWHVPPFVQPLSDRKDGGYMMDITGFKQPLKVQGSNGTVKCQSKIVYMGVIDILQQFNLRKRVETKWRRAQGAGWKDASCVHPDLYADRFIAFFDEYTKRELAEAGKSTQQESAESTKKKTRLKVEFSEDPKGDSKAEIEVLYKSESKEAEKTEDVNETEKSDDHQSKTMIHSPDELGTA